MNKIRLNKFVIVISMIIGVIYLISFLNFSLYDFNTTNTHGITIKNGIDKSEIPLNQVKSALAVSSNYTVKGVQSSSLNPSSTLSNISIDVTSSHSIHGIAGQFVKVNGTITNNNHVNTKTSGIAYISIVDL